MNSLTRTLQKNKNFETETDILQEQERNMKRNDSPSELFFISHERSLHHDLKEKKLRTKNSPYSFGTDLPEAPRNTVGLILTCYETG